MKKLLYIDRPFKKSLGGDKNRSRYIYNTLKKDFDVKTAIVLTDTEREEASFVLRGEQKAKFFLPEAIMEFSESTMNSFLFFIKENGITELFFRSIAFTQLAIYVKDKIPTINIIVDVDLILSRLMQQAWEKKKSLRSRYYFIQSLKLLQYEKKLYQNNFTFLFSNEEECIIIEKLYINCKTKYLANTTDLTPQIPTIGKKGVILMYGAMDSTANIDAYNYLENKLYQYIESKLEENNYEIHIVGKGCNVLTPSRHERIKILGKVDSIEETILESSFVLLPIYIASGTNTRVLETAMAGRALVTTPLGMEGLVTQKEQAYVADDLDEMVAKVGQMIEDDTYRISMAKSLQDNIMHAFSYEKFEKSLLSIMEMSHKEKSLLVHVPRRFTQNSWGGTETVVLNSANYLRDYGYESEIYTSNALDSRKEEKLDSIPIKRFSYFYPFFPLSKKQKGEFDAIGGNLFSFSLLLALFRRKNITLIHLHTLKRMGAIVRSIAKWRKIPYVITLHGGYFNISKGEVNHRQEQRKYGYEWGKVLGWIFGSRSVMDDATAIITLSDIEYEKAYEKYGSKVHYLSNGVDVEKFSKGNGENFKRAYNIPLEKKMILCSARIDTQKNQLLLLETFTKLIKEHKDLHLVFLGTVSDQEYYHTLKNEINMNKLNSNVTFVQNLTPKDQLLVDAYCAAEMLVLSSRHEPFGMVILEAWAAGIPVVASSTGGIVKIITHEKDGLLFKNDDMSDLYDQMERLIQDDMLRYTLIENSLDEVKQYDWKNIAQKLDNIYVNVLEEKRVA